MNDVDFSAPLKYLPELLAGTLATVWISALIYVLMLVVSTAIGVLRFSVRSRILGFILSAYIEIFRNIPALVVLFLFYFGLPQFGVNLGSYGTGIIVSVIVLSAYTAETIRGSLQSIPKGQWEAAASLGLSTSQAMIRIALPQAFKKIWPALTNMLMITIFSTSLLSVIDVRELTHASGLISSRTFRTLEVYVFALAIYYGISTLFRFGFHGLFRAFFVRKGIA